MKFQSFESEMSFAGITLPIRSCLIREDSKGILISPVNLSDTDIQKIRSEGGVTDIVAPNLLHHLYVKKAKSAFPEAVLWGVEGLAKKRPDIRWDKTLTEKDWPYNDFLKVVESKGAPDLNEILLFHRNSRTLIVSDLCFNLQKAKGPLSSIVFRLMGTYKRFNVSKLVLKYIKDKRAFSRSMNEVFNWDFDRIAMSHGEVIETGGKTLFQSALKNRGLI